MKIISNKTHKTFVIGQYKNVSFKISLKSDMEECFIEPMVLCWSFNMGMQYTNSITKVKQTRY